MNNIEKQLTYKTTILVREYDQTRCAHECPHIRKKRGVYKCILFEKYVDKGYDDRMNDHHLERCTECVDATVEGTGIYYTKPITPGTGAY